VAVVNQQEQISSLQELNNSTSEDVKLNIQQIVENFQKKLPEKQMKVKKKLLRLTRDYEQIVQNGLSGINNVLDETLIVITIVKTVNVHALSENTAEEGENTAALDFAFCAFIPNSLFAIGIAPKRTSIWDVPISEKYPSCFFEYPRNAQAIFLNDGVDGKFGAQEGQDGGFRKTFDIIIKNVDKNIPLILNGVSVEGKDAQGLPEMDKPIVATVGEWKKFAKEHENLRSFADFRKEYEAWQAKGYSTKDSI
jgi:hypothetical protein